MLTYNSQNWRQDPGGTWKLGRDVGYGYGWRLQAASLTPIYRDYWTLDHYLFIDSTGAEYNLNVHNGYVWSSQESIYVYYDTSYLPARLCFTDGSFWQFGSTSAGTEQDAGTMYPTFDGGFQWQPDFNHVFQRPRSAGRQLQRSNQSGG